MRIGLLEGRIVSDITHVQGSVKDGKDKDSYCHFRIATKGYRKDESFFFNVEAFGRHADDINKYFKKASPIVIVSEIYTKEKDGKWYTNFRVLRWEFSTTPAKNKDDGGSDDAPPPPQGLEVAF